jgi:hypothetical protein
MQAVRARKAAQGKAQLSLRQIRRISVAKTTGGLQSPEPGSAAPGGRTTPSPRQVMFASTLCETNMESSFAWVLVTPALHHGMDLDRAYTGWSFFSRPQRLAKVWGDALNPWLLCTILNAQSLRTSGRLHSEAPDEDPTVDRGLPGAGPSPRHTGVPGPVKATWGVSPRAATSRMADNKRGVSRQGLGLGATGTTNRSGTGMGTGSQTARLARHGSALELQGG